MKLVFVGPSLPDLPQVDGVQFRSPAALGDLDAAIAEGANVVGIIDGLYEQTASVWHKEILAGLSAGVQIFGGASMGALRAAECASFGMIPVGKIAEAYCSGELDDDAAVALIHAPAELGHLPLTEPLVDALATIEVLADTFTVGAEACMHLRTRARALSFRVRTIESMAEGLPESAEVIALYRQNHVRAKARDAREVIDAVAAASDFRVAKPTWSLQVSPFWRPTAVGNTINV